jgi:hypothetical protein
MELLFNELSLEPLSDNSFIANEKMVKFTKALSIARQNGYRYLRSDSYASQLSLASDYNLHDWISNKQVPEIYRNLVLGMIVQPFIKDENEEIEEQYILSSYFFEENTLGIDKRPCVGLAGAYLYETLSASIPSLPIWENAILPILIEKETGDVFTDNVHNIATEDSFSNPVILDFLEKSREIVPIKTSIPFDKKKIHIASHHGEAELKALCKRLRNNEYVVEMRSMEWCRGRCNNFVKKIYKNGTIELVLYKEQIKYGLLVQTTGRNYSETKMISEILDKNYS